MRPTSEDPFARAVAELDAAAEAKKADNGRHSVTQMSHLATSQTCAQLAIAAEMRVGNLIAIGAQLAARHGSPDATGYAAAIDGILVRYAENVLNSEGSRT